MMKRHREAMHVNSNLNLFAARNITDEFNYYFFMFFSSFPMHANHLSNQRDTYDHVLIKSKFYLFSSVKFILKMIRVKVISKLSCGNRKVNIENH